jgi:hypothetical protein
VECDSVCGLWLTRAGNNDEKNAGRDDNVGVCHIIDQGGALRSALRVLISASIIPVNHHHQPSILVRQRASTRGCPVISPSYLGISVRRRTTYQ